MLEATLTWRTIDDIAAQLGAKKEARLKWRQRGVPPHWKIEITQALMARGVPVALADFEALPIPAGRIAA
jgi:hypothetical protein